MYSDYRKTEELGTLREVARALAAGTSASDLLNILCEAATNQGRSIGASVVEVGTDTGTFVAVRGPSKELMGLRFPLAGSVTGRVAQERKTISITSPNESSPLFAELLPKLGIGPIMVLPLLAQSQLMGVLSVFRREGETKFDAHDESRLAAVADLAALALWKTSLLEEAQSADAAKTSLLATLSHELRTPLAALEGYGELLEDEILGPLTSSQRDALVRLRTVSRHLGSLIEDILTYASLEADRLSIRVAPLEVASLLDSLLPFVEPLAREKGIAFRLELADALPDLVTDEDRLRQILLNLVQNAVKFTERGEVLLRVTLGTPTADGVPCIRFVVRDTGVGIDAADLPRLFRPFSQLEDVQSRRHRGTGLGLYISRRLASLLGGRVEVVSRPSEGSQFTLVLPVVR
ncbi:MAG: GAF domain-containing protein [Gemmatimonadaceae bacterium]|nr:GAF domain-containing protein [Gemmatimonadaceae bacterium]